VPVGGKVLEQRPRAAGEIEARDELRGDSMEFASRAVAQARSPFDQARAKQGLEQAMDGAGRQPCTFAQFAEREL
jgi:hypothetical protein